MRLRTASHAIAVLLLSAFVSSGAAASPAANNPNAPADAKISLAPDAGAVYSQVGSAQPKTVANGLVMTGNLSYSRNGGVVTLTAAGINNNSTTRTSGTLRLELWATSIPPSRGGAITGYRLAVGNTLTPLQPGFQYTNVVQTVSFLEPAAAGTYYIVLSLGEFDSNNCFGDDSYCTQDSLVFTNQQTFGNVTPPPPAPSVGGSAKSLGSRSTVTTAATLFGAFEIASTTQVYIAVRGNSLGTLGVTQAFLDAPRVRLFNAQGADLVTQGGLPGFNFCLATNTTTDLPILNYYASVRGAPIDSRDSCYATTLSPGAYTFTVTPSISGSTSNSATSANPSGQVLFEVTLLSP